MEVFFVVILAHFSILALLRSAFGIYDAMRLHLGHRQCKHCLRHSICTHLVRLGNGKTTSFFDVFDVSGYGSQMQKQVFAHSHLAHFCRCARL